MKHPRISKTSAVPFCTYQHPLLQPVPLAPYAYQRYIRRASLAHVTAAARIYRLPCGCFLWVLSTGGRHLSALPF